VTHVPSVGRAWWCCTMHGYRAFRDVLDAVVRSDGSRVRVDLFEDVDWDAEGIALSLRHRSESPLRSRLTIQVRRAAKDAPVLALRVPEWAQSVALSVNGSPVSSGEAPAYHEIGQRLLAGDHVEMAITHRASIETRDGRRLAPAEVGGEVEGILAAGPWLYAVDDGLEPLYFGEPWQGANVVSLPSALHAPTSWPPERPFQDPRRHLAAHYEHGGFSGSHPLVLRPIAEQTGRAPGTVATWIRFRSEA
jgi:Beta-L-arabinofuranosidase, GH127 middle domain